MNPSLSETCTNERTRRAKRTKNDVRGVVQPERDVPAQVPVALTQSVQRGCLLRDDRLVDDLRHTLASALCTLDAGVLVVVDGERDVPCLLSVIKMVTNEKGEEIHSTAIIEGKMKDSAVYKDEECSSQ